MRQNDEREVCQVSEKNNEFQTHFMEQSRTYKSGFTLVELAIVLVIIALLAGGILVGQDLIRAASERAQISQIEQYKTASNTFLVKYGYLPGDIPEPYATRFGFVSRGTQRGQGDGDGRITGWFGIVYYGWAQQGEPLLFWRDLSQSGLINEVFNLATSNTSTSSDLTGNGIGDYLPKAKISDDIYVYNISASMTGWFTSPTYYTSNDFFAISKIQEISFASRSSQLAGTAGISVISAYNIDSKIDDGLPLRGNVTTINAGPKGSGDIFTSNGDKNVAMTTTLPGSSGIVASQTTCYDNGNNASNPLRYSLSINGGAGKNCGLGFRKN